MSRTPAPLRSVRSLMWMVGGLLWLAGCSSSPPLEELTAYMREQQRNNRAPLELDQVEITKSELSGDAAVWNMEVKITAKSKVDLFDPITLEEVYAHYKYDPQKQEYVLKRMAVLREPERSEAAKKRPEVPRRAACFRKSLAAGSSFSYSVNMTAEKKGSTWTFMGDLDSIRIDGVTLQTSVRGELPAGAIILDGDKENSITKLMRDEETFAAAVANAEKAMTERLARERKELLEASSVGRAWLVAMPVRNGPSTKVRAQFVERSDEGKVVVLLSNAEQFSQRSVWVGKLDLPPAPTEKESGTRTRPNPDGWSIVLTTAVKDEFLPLTDGRQPIKLSISADRQLQWDHKNSPLTFAEDAKAPKLPDYTSLAQEFESGTAPGQTWEGTLQYGGQAAQRARLTFTERRDEGQYLRAVVELADNPFVLAVLEGTVDTSIEAVYGFPIRLHRTNSAGPGTFWVHATPLFKQGTTGTTRLNLAGSLDDKRLLQGGGLQLVRAEPLAGAATHRERWKQALEPGARWSGKLEFANQPITPITITVAEVREEGKYVRLTAENPDTRNRFRVFEGSLDTADSAVDGYALTITGMFPTPMPTRHDTGGHADVFGVLKSPQHLRLLPDGKTLLCMSRHGQLELVTLTRDRQPAPMSLKKDDIAKVWRERIVQGSQWRGRLKNLAWDKSIDVELQILTTADEMGNLTASIGMVGEPKSTIGFSGTLRLDSDVTANGYALDLAKESISSKFSESPILGSVKSGIHVWFRLGPNGDELIGYSPDTPNTQGPEVLELRLVERPTASKVSAKKSVPRN